MSQSAGESRITPSSDNIGLTITGADTSPTITLGTDKPLPLQQAIHVQAYFTTIFQTTTSDRSSYEVPRDE